MTARRLALWSVLSISFGLLVNEIMLSAIFHVLLGAGNTVAAIAIALVGLSAGGIAAYSIPALQRPERARSLVGALVFWFAASLVVSVYAIMGVPIHHGDLIYHSADPSVQFWRLAVHQITVVPFFLGGLTIAVVFRSEPGRIGRLYFADLLGAALGCVASPALLWRLGAPGAVLMGAIPAVLLGSLLVWRGGGQRRALVALPVLLLGASVVRPELLSFSKINTMGEVNAPAYRSFPIRAGDIEYERWALDAWTIIRGPQMAQQWENFRGWGLSPHYRGFVPETKLVNYNARFSTYVTRRDGDPRALGDWLDADLTSLHHAVGRHYDDVLNIGAGGGREVLAALHHGAERVVAVDVSEVVVEDLMKGHLLGFSGNLYLDPRVEPVADEGRSFTERTDERFDLVEFSIVGGMNLEKMDLVRVDDLFTREALRTYLVRLKEDGVFSYVMYSTRSDIVSDLARAEAPGVQPYIPALRTLTGLRVALEEVEPGSRFSDHVLVAALPRVINPRYDLVHIVVGRAPFTRAERQRFVATCRRLGFAVLHPADPEPREAPNLYARIAGEGDLPALAAKLPFSIWPPTDDRPFQYALEPSHLWRALGRGELLSLLAANPFVSLGLSIGSLAALLTLTPLLLSRRRAENLRAFRSNWGMLLYFACIGFAYMGVEIAALLRLQSYLGKPIYGLSVGLFAFLLASGLGSNSTGRLSDRRLGPSVGVVVGALVSAGLVFAWLSPTLFAATISFPLPARVGIAVASIFPIAFLMGMLFPIGVRILARSSADLVPWAWATNGCFSVLGIFSARITALIFGFSRALLVGLFVYLLVVACVWVHSRGAHARSSPAHST
jgi:SAM-dependent methyltransferase